ncbi:MAG TPA: hypothetical protein VKT29_17000, partial [Terriglobales bacterium]|nr:hypothetical protein [Terriglobales bacterium]
PVVAPSEKEVARVAAVKEQWAQKLLRGNPAVFGVGVGGSYDSPGEAALVIFVDQDMSYTPPAIIDGARVRVRRSDRFRAWGWNEHQRTSACSGGSFPQDQQLLQSDQWGGAGLKPAGNLPQ